LILLGVDQSSARWPARQAHAFLGYELSGVVKATIAAGQVALQR
jgi:hypothetical protein